MNTRRLKLEELPEYQGRKVTCFGVGRDANGDFQRRPQSLSLGVLNQYASCCFEVQCHSGPLVHRDQIIYDKSIGAQRLFDLTEVRLVVDDTTVYRIHEIGFVPKR